MVLQIAYDLSLTKPRLTLRILWGSNQSIARLCAFLDRCEPCHAAAVFVAIWCADPGLREQPILSGTVLVAECGLSCSLDGF